ncbi:MAG: glycosyltransferase family 2 protein [Granulosicoccus sp.]|nr:glycosyltransferase family 2 protein [Granulosicoccus sp.]
MSSDALIWLQNQFYNRVVGTALPLSWFAPPAPRPDALTMPEGRLQLQIVSHSWQYAHLSLFQLSSLVNYPPQHCDVTYTLFHAAEDTPMRQLIERFSAMDVPNVTWDWQVLPKPELFRRAIGRNRAALASRAHWIWFADCDLIFHEGCLDSLARAAAPQRTGLLFPDHEGITDLLPASHPMLNQDDGLTTTVDIDPGLFRYNRISKAKGAFQIVHGDVARAVGYCASIGLYQQPTDTWRKTFEDTVFRRVIEYEGEAVTVDNLYRIRHAEKGRYTRGSLWGTIRGRIRQLTDRTHS